MDRSKKWICFFFFYSFVLIGQEKFIFYFNQDKATPLPSSVAAFENWKKKNKDTIEVLGLKSYCDSVSSKAYNQILATKRNKNIALYLKKLGIKHSVSYFEIAVGEEFENDTILALNRKVEVYFQKKEVEKNVNPINHKNNSLPQIKENHIEEITDNSNNPKTLSLFSKQLEEAKDGERIQIFDIHFYLDSPEMIMKSEPYLNRIVTFMETNPEVSIKIEGHMCCNILGGNKLSKNRAKNIYLYLLKKGIDRKRMSYEGYGVSNPIYEIPEKTPEEEQKNRRVEILVSRKNG